MTKKFSSVLVLSLSLIQLYGTYGYAGKKHKQADAIVLPKKKSGRFNEAALFLAGLNLPEGSKLKKYSSHKTYVRYKNLIDKSWNGFLLTNAEKSRVWSKKFLPGNYSHSVFYPFSGPDILHPLTFYPDALDIVMFGLERIGRIPDPMSMRKSRVLRDLWSIPRALNFTLKHAYFITKHMMSKIGKNRYTGITGIIMFFLARGGYDILNVRKIWIDYKGRILKKHPGRMRRVPGIEIIFRQTGEKILRRARFFRLDISNRSKSLPLFRLFVKGQSMFATIIKSASYLMHNRKFSRIKNIVLNRSSSILQDDSGLPYRAFSKKRWKLAYHGNYHKPLKIFRWYYQKDLKEKMAKYSTGPLPFTYGYGFAYEDMKYHLLLAERKK